MFKTTKINLVIASLFSVTAFAADLTTDKIEVVSQTPLPSIGLPLNIIPANIQIIKSKQINNEGGVSIADALQNNGQGINLNSTQGNPFQPDILFRGYTASPLLGTPQGMSVYVDGVRVNEPFGDVVNWDLIPNFAISGMQVVPGSNPIYGLNTLGGAISIQTKDGRSNPGAAIEAEAGSWGRKRALVEYGGVSKDGSVDYYFGGQSTEEDGWRKYSPSRVNQTFGKLGWQNTSSKFNLSYIGADNKLTGNGLTPTSLLSGDRDQIHTRPDITDNYMHHFTLNASNWLSDDVMISANGFYRKSNRHSVNGDLNDEFNGPNDYFEYFGDPSKGGGVTYKAGSDINATAGTVNSWVSANPNSATYNTLASWIRTSGITTALTNGADLADDGILNNSASGPTSTILGKYLVCEDVMPSGKGTDYCAPASINRSNTKQDRLGLTLQAAFNQDIFGKKNQFITGLGFDFSKMKFRSTEQKSNIDDLTFYDINTNGKTLFFGADGLPINLGDIEDTVKLNGKSWTYSLFATDTMSINERLHLTAAARYNNTRIKNTDILNAPSDSNSLGGKHKFDRLNPSIGAVYLFPEQNMSIFGSYAESSRAPTSIELGCANKDNACLLPNAMAGDPPLNQVIAKSFDGGLRGRIGSNFNWSVSAYHTQNINDIQFIWSGTGSRGYFSNVGDTERQGFDVSFGGKYEKLGFNMSYSYIDATYDSQFQIANNANSSQSSGIITVKPGANIPGISPNQIKLRLEYELTSKWTIGSNLMAYSEQYIFGNENNAHNAAKSSSRPGFAKLGGYAIVNLDTQYDVGNGLKFFAKATNIFDKDYYAAGRLGETHIDPTGWQGLNERRYAQVVPGAPQAAWVGVRYEFGGNKKQD